MPLSSEHYKRDPGGMLPIHHAIADNDVDTVVAILEEDAALVCAPSLSIRGKILNTPLEIAVENDAPEVFLVLLKYNPPLQMANHETGDTILHVLAREEFIEAFDNATLHAFLLNCRAAGILDAYNFNLETALSISYQMLDFEFANALLAAGANPYQPGPNGSNYHFDDEDLKHPERSVHVQTFLTSWQIQRTPPQFDIAQRMQLNFKATPLGKISPAMLLLSLVGKQYCREQNQRNVFQPRLFSSVQSFMEYLGEAIKHAPKPFIINAIVSLEPTDPDSPEGGVIVHHRMNMYCVLTEDTIYAIELDGTADFIPSDLKPHAHISNAYANTILVKNNEFIQFAERGCEVFAQYFSEKLSNLSAQEAIRLIQSIHQQHGISAPNHAFPTKLGLQTVSQSMNTIRKALSNHPGMLDEVINHRNETLSMRLSKAQYWPFYLYKYTGQEGKPRNGALVQKQMKQGDYANLALQLPQDEIYRRMQIILGWQDIKMWKQYEFGTMDYLLEIIRGMSWADFAKTSPSTSQKQEVSHAPRS